MDLAGLTTEQAAVAALAIFGGGTLFWLKSLNEKVQGAASRAEVAELRRQMDANWGASDRTTEKVKALSDLVIDARAKIEAQTHRIDEHAARNSDVAKNYRELVDDLARENRQLMRETK